MKNKFESISQSLERATHEISSSNDDFNELSMWSTIVEFP